ncbi:MAG: OmpA family protein [Thiobacillus sp.]|uniref:OmpA family protein n=1 Tax=Thiobacillus sp. TaxID=924 RepID=UPI002894649A|nr:OmpA family protein [Thiobacillus sp.]MDT3706453.1 OmpA family protein [Thiobacillus sp.]
MHKTSYLYSALGATLLSAGFATGAQGVDTFYNPANPASPTGYTVGHELFRTIGCPGRGLLDTPCQVVDSDGDGVPDYRDKCPTVPAQTPDGCPLPVAAPAAAPAPAAALAPAAAPAPVMPDMRGVNFDFDKSYVRQEDFANLDHDVTTLKQWGDVKVEVAGHTDSIGTDEYNMGLSMRRADAVRMYLIDKGIAADRLTARGYGESQPIADNATEEGRFKNRRVELIPQK